MINDFDYKWSTSRKFLKCIFLYNIFKKLVILYYLHILYIVIIIYLYLINLLYYLLHFLYNLLGHI